jgi:cytidylate kinase
MVRPVVAELKKHPISKENILSGLVVAIDGPAGSGKSTTARLVAQRMGYRHIDTGAMYRSVALKVLRSAADPEDPSACGAAAESIRIEFRDGPDGQRVLSDGQDVTVEIRSPEVTRAVSPVSAHPTVRAAMVRQQRLLAQTGGVVLEGRDIGTVVLPSAEVKVYLVASTRVRAQRRLREMAGGGTAPSIDDVEREIVRRDAFDSSRETSPLRRAVGAVEVDTTELSIEEQVGRVMEIAGRTADRLAALEPTAGACSYRRLRPHYAVGCVLIRSVLKLLFGLQVHYKAKVDYHENYIYACNHKSYADPPFVGSTLPREVHFVAKAGLFGNRLFGWLIRSFNAVPLRRGVFDREAMNLVLELLGERHSLMIFPEGSRVHTGELGKPKSGVGYLALNSGTAVVPVFVSGTDRLWRCLFRRERLYMAVGRPVRVAEETREEFRNNDGYRAYAEMVLEAIRALKDEHETGRRRQRSAAGV